MAHTETRLGECLAMHRNHLDVSNCQYMILESVKRERFGHPKTGKRLIDIPEGLVDKLDRHIKALRKELFSEGKDVEYLFPGITQRTVQKCNEARVPACETEGQNSA